MKAIVGISVCMLALMPLPAAAANSGPSASGEFEFLTRQSGPGIGQHRHVVE